MNEYHYTESGLTHVVLCGIEVGRDDLGDEFVTIPRIRALHRVIAEGIVSQDSSIRSDELRFLRTEMGLTQAELGSLVHRDRQAIMSWEKGARIDENAEAIIRRHAIERLSLDIDLEIARLSEMVSAAPDDDPIKVERCGDEYRLALAA